MKLCVEPVYTIVDADYIESQLLEQLLVAPTEEGERSLFENGRFYSGLLKRVTDILTAQAIDFEIEYTYDNPEVDPATIEIPDGILPGIELRSHQVVACFKLIAHGTRGIVSIATGGGKTEVACAVAKYHSVPTLFVNDRVKHAEQAQKRFTKYGIDCGMLGGGRREFGHLVTSAVADSLYSGLQRHDEDVIELLNETKLLIFDECHHASSNSWMAVGSNCPASMRFGLSASAFDDPEDRQYEDMLLIGQTGEVVCHVPPKWLIERKYLAEPLVFFIPINTNKPNSYDYHTVYKQGISENNYRNYAVAGMASLLVRHGRKVLILVQRIPHGQQLLKLLRDPSVIFSFGGEETFRWEAGKVVKGEKMSIDDISAIYESMSAGTLIGSTVFDESVDLSSVTDLIMAGGGKKYRRILQRVGRAAHSRDETVNVFDFWDYQHPYLTKHSRERLHTYNLLEYKAYQGLQEFTHRSGIPVNIEEVVMGYVRQSPSSIFEEPEPA